MSFTDFAKDYLDKLTSNLQDNSSDAISWARNAINSELILKEEVRDRLLDGTEFILDAPMFFNKVALNYKNSDDEYAKFVDFIGIIHLLMLIAYRKKREDDGGFREEVSVGEKGYSMLNYVPYFKTNGNRNTEYEVQGKDFPALSCKSLPVDKHWNLKDFMSKIVEEKSVDQVQKYYEGLISDNKDDNTLKIILIVLAVILGLILLGAMIYALVKKGKKSKK